MTHGRSGGSERRIIPQEPTEAPPNVTDTEKSPVVRALRLLSYLAQSRGPVPLADISRALALPKATVHRLARMLEEVGFVQKNPLTLRYSVGARFEDIALDALRSGGGTNRRRFLMDGLSERLGVRTNFAVLKAGKLTLVEWVESSSLIRIDLKAGIQVPAHCSASGKLLMAFAPDDLRERFLATAPFRALTKSTITSAQAMARELAQIRRRGYAEDNQEFLVGISCLAVPVRNSSGEVVAGLGVMGPAHDFPLAKARENLTVIQAYADEISAESGWTAAAMAISERPQDGKAALSIPAKAARTERKSADQSASKQAAGRRRRSP